MADAQEHGATVDGFHLVRVQVAVAVTTKDASA